MAEGITVLAILIFFLFCYKIETNQFCTCSLSSQLTTVTLYCGMSSKFCGTENRTSWFTHHSLTNLAMNLSSLSRDHEKWHFRINTRTWLWGFPPCKFPADKNYVADLNSQSLHLEAQGHKRSINAWSYLGIGENSRFLDISEHIEKGMVLWLRHRSRTQGLGSIPSSATDLLCDLWQVI